MLPSSLLVTSLRVFSFNGKPVIVIFWACVVLVLYTYVVYPLTIRLLAHFRPSRSEIMVPVPTSVSFVVAACDEGFRIVERLEELVQQLEHARVDGEVILVLDGPGYLDTFTGKVLEDPRVQIIELSERRGKAMAISEGAQRARHDILAFADVRQRWQEDALYCLLENFRNSRVGAVSGDLVLQTGDGITAGVGLYWRYEKWLRRNEGVYDSVVGVTGAICAVRRDLFHGVPAGAILDDVYWPLRVVQQGYRVVHDPAARAFDHLPENARDEFRRKVRTLSGNFQLVQLLPSLLLPWKNRIWWQFVSHKLMRLAVPWLLLVALVACAIENGAIYQALFWGQTTAYSVLALLMASGLAARHRVASAAASFALLNTAAWLAFWIWLTGRAGKSWNVTQYASETLRD